MYFFLLVVSILGAGFVQASGGGDATFSLIPATGTYRSQEEFVLELRLNTGKPATSLRAYLSFDPSLLNVVRIEKGDSLPYWWESKAENGMVKLSASAPTPGVSGQIAVAKLIFKGQRSGETMIDYDGNSIVLDAADQDILNLASSTKGNLMVVAATELDSGSEAAAKGSSGNFLGLLFGVVGVLLVGVVLFIMWKKLQKGNKIPQ